MFQVGEATQFPWLLSTSGPGLALLMLGVFLLSRTVARAIGPVYLAAFLAALCLLVVATGIATSNSPRYLFLGTWDMSGPIRPWKNPYLQPLETNGVAVVEFYRVGGVTYRDESGIVGDLAGPFVSSNQFAACLAMTLPVLIGLIFWLANGGRSPAQPPTARRAVGVVSVASWILGVVMLSYYCESWAGTAAFVLATAFTLGLTARKASRTRKSLWALGIMGLAASLLMFLALVGWVPLPQVLSETLAPARSSAGHRLHAWEYAAAAWWQAPWTGIGWGNYRYSQPDDVINCFYFTHNDYLQVAAETGLLGIGALCALLVYLLIRIVRVANAWDLGRDQFLVLGTCAGIVSIVLHSLFDYNLRVPLNALACAVLLGILPGRHKQTDATFLSPGGWTRFAALLFVAGIALQWNQHQRDSTFLAINRAVVTTRSAADANERHAAQQQLATTLQACEIRNANSVHEAVICGKAYLHLSQGTQPEQLQVAADWFQQAISLYPRDADRNTLVQIQQALRDIAHCATLPLKKDESLSGMNP
jgi:hypothetical protein